MFIKTNWNSCGESYKNLYEPEKMIRLTKEVIDIIKRVYKLDSYCILTHGVHLIDEDTNLFRNNQENHYFVGSIATPFIELFDIEKTVKKVKKENIKILNSMYLSMSLFLSLKLKDQQYRSKLQDNYIKFDSTLSKVGTNKFLSLSIDELIEKI